jgi:hypothetical protein
LFQSGIRTGGQTFYLRGCSYGEMSRITGIPRNMIIDGYIGTFPALVVGGKEYAAGFGPLTEYPVMKVNDAGVSSKKSSDQVNEESDGDAKPQPDDARLSFDL